MSKAKQLVDSMVREDDASKPKRMGHSPTAAWADAIESSGKRLAGLISRDPKAYTPDFTNRIRNIYADLSDLLEEVENEKPAAAVEPEPSVEKVDDINDKIRKMVGFGQFPKTLGDFGRQL